MHFHAQHVGKFSVNLLNVFLNSQQIPLQVAQAGESQLNFLVSVPGIEDEDAFPQIVVNAVSCSSHSSKLAGAIIYPGHLLSFI